MLVCCAQNTLLLLLVFCAIQGTIVQFRYLVETHMTLVMCWILGMSFPIFYMLLRIIYERRFLGTRSNSFEIREEKERHHHHHHQDGVNKDKVKLKRIIRFIGKCGYVMRNVAWYILRKAVLIVWFYKQ